MFYKVRVLKAEAEGRTKYNITAVYTTKCQFGEKKGPTDHIVGISLTYIYQANLV
jgi:hypothetical protein